jgi:hypothetical protein
VQLVTLPDGTRLRSYWQAGQLLGETQTLPSDRDLPDGEYRVGKRERLLPMGPRPERNTGPMEPHEGIPTECLSDQQIEQLAVEFAAMGSEEAAHVAELRQFVVLRHLIVAGVAAELNVSPAEVMARLVDEQDPTTRRIIREVLEEIAPRIHGLR